MIRSYSFCCRRRSRRETNDSSCAKKWQLWSFQNINNSRVSQHNSVDVTHSLPLILILNATLRNAKHQNWIKTDSAGSSFAFLKRFTHMCVITHVRIGHFSLPRKMNRNIREEKFVLKIRAKIKTHNNKAYAFNIEFDAAQLKNNNKLRITDILRRIMDLFSSSSSVLWQYIRFTLLIENTFGFEFFFFFRLAFKPEGDE